VPLELASSLAVEVSRFEKAASLQAFIDKLASGKYETPAWLAMR
jgi:hypothetical protein